MALQLQPVGRRAQLDRLHILAISEMRAAVDYVEASCALAVLNPGGVRVKLGKISFSVHR